MAIGRRTPPPPPDPSTRIPDKELNPVERAEAGETVEVSLPLEEQPDPIYGFGPFPESAPTNQE